MTQTHRLRVFVNQNGKFGDEASVVIDEGKQLSTTERLALTHTLATGETAFIDDIAKARVSIMHYDGELDFAGVAALAVASVLTRLNTPTPTALYSKGGAIKMWQTKDVTWVQAKLSTMPGWHFKQLEDATEVERLSPQRDIEHTMFWAWIDEAKGLIRARTFASDWGIPEAEGNGSGAMLLAAKLGRAVEIKHGKGSVIFAKPAHDNTADIGGRIIEA